MKYRERKSIFILVLWNLVELIENICTHSGHFPHGSSWANVSAISESLDDSNWLSVQDFHLLVKALCSCVDGRKLEVYIEVVSNALFVWTLFKHGMWRWNVTVETVSIIGLEWKKVVKRWRNSECLGWHVEWSIELDTCTSEISICYTSAIINKCAHSFYNIHWARSLESCVVVNSCSGLSIRCVVATYWEVWLEHTSETIEYSWGIGRNCERWFELI